MTASNRTIIPLGIAAFAIAGTVAFLASSLQPGTFRAQAFVSEATTERALGPGAAETATSRQRLELHARVAESQRVLEQAIARLDLDTGWSTLARQVDAIPSEDATRLGIAVESRDPAFAASLANVIAEEVVAAASSDRSSTSTLAADIDLELEARVERLDSLKRQIERLTSTEDLSRYQRRRLQSLERSLDVAPSTIAQLLPFSSESSAGVLTVVNPATTPTTPFRPVPLLDALLAGFLGVVLILPLALIPHFLDRTISTPDDVRAATGLPILAVVPRVAGDLRRPAVAAQAMLAVPESTTADAYRRASIGLRMWQPSLKRRVILVAAPRRTGAKRATAANLALAMAQSGRKVILLDADLDRPTAHKMLGVPNGPGLAEALAGEVDDPVSLLAETPQPRLRLLTAGDAGMHIQQHIGSASMRRVLDRLRADYDVIIDGPPLRDSAAGEVLGPEVDGVLLALALGRSRRTEVGDAVDALRFAGAPFVGAMLVHLPPRLLGGLVDHLPRLGHRRSRSATTAPSWPQLAASPPTARVDPVPGPSPLPGRGPAAEAASRKHGLPSRPVGP